NDNIVIASVSCIYNIGDPIEFSSRVIDFKINQNWDRRQLFKDLIHLFYKRSEIDFKRATFRLRGPIIEIWPSYQDWILSLEFEQGKLIKINQRHPFSGHQFDLKEFRLYPAKQYVGGSSEEKSIFKKIKKDCQKQVKLFKSQNKILEAHRIKQKVNYDLEMLQETGYVSGIENYSIYFEKNRISGQPPFTLLDYFNHRWGKNFLTIIDESHVTVPQIKGMHAGDLARKKTLVDFGFRLPSAFDNRPLKAKEFWSKTAKTIFLSATPADFELEKSKHSFLQCHPYRHPDHPQGGEGSHRKYQNQGDSSSSSQNDGGTLPQNDNFGIVEQIIRPTGLIDPKVTIESTKNQIPHLISQIHTCVSKGQRALVITLTKRMAEDLSTYLSDPTNTAHNFKVAYLHADINTLERTEILKDLRDGSYDVLVGINLLREGLDLPEVSLVAILDADKQGFLRSKSSLIQIMGRASRHIEGRVILYADSISLAMSQAIKEVNRRRRIQLAYNKKHCITPKSISKAIRPEIISVKTHKIKSQSELMKVDPLSLTPFQRQKHITKLRRQMRLFANDLDFESAIKVRNQILKIEKT
ncbi:UvrB/UvrC motif-containing protein, partial [Patescibacteria group bacterium]|nr:UvrB/UvrC motif-containing protein [Patescibacteria group bacterium]